MYLSSEFFVNDRARTTHLEWRHWGVLQPNPMGPLQATTRSAMLKLLRGMHTCISKGKKRTETPTITLLLLLSHNIARSMQICIILLWYRNRFILTKFQSNIGCVHRAILFMLLYLYSNSKWRTHLIAVSFQVL